jgi:hypothetical protein
MCFLWGRLWETFVMSTAQEKAECHVREARKIVTAQKRLIGHLQARRLSTSEAEASLALFERTLQIFEAGLDGFERARSGSPPLYCLPASGVAAAISLHERCSNGPARKAGRALVYDSEIACVRPKRMP